MNNVVLMGRLTADPKINEGSVKVASYTLAVDRTKKAENGEKVADFISIKAFDKKADFAQNYLHKGTKLVVRGRIQTGKYTNKDGVTVYTTDVVVDDQEFAESKQNAEANAVQTGTKPKDEFGKDEFVIPDDLNDDGLPFV